MRNIRTEWFYNDKSPKEIKCPTVGLFKNKEDALCYLLALNLYPKLYPQDIYYSWILENNQTGYLNICGNNRDTVGHMQFKFIKGE